MKFERNKHNEKGVFSEIFNTMVGRYFNEQLEQLFYAEAEKAGYAEARVRHYGDAPSHDRGQKRITAWLDDKGHVQDFHFS